MRGCVVAVAAVTMLTACHSEPVRTTAGPPDTTGDGSAAAPSLPQPLESLPPVPAARMTAEQQQGRAVYSTLCRACHGLYGHGDGPAARAFPGSLPALGRLAWPATVSQIVARMQVPHAQAGSDSAPPVWHALPPDTLRVALAYLRTMSSPGSRGNPAAGRLLYATYCVQCHGVRGAGDGRLAAPLASHPSDLRALRFDGREARVFANIRSGGPSPHLAYMPDWGRVLTDQQLWDLVAYLRILRVTR